MAVNLDFSNVPDRVALPEGVYQGTISAAEMKTSSTGNPMLAVTYDINADDGVHKVFDNYTLVERAMFKLKDLLKALGYDVSGSLSFDEADLIGGMVNLKVVQEEYNGEIVNRVKKVMQAA